MTLALDRRQLWSVKRQVRDQVWRSLEEAEHQTIAGGMIWYPEHGAWVKNLAELMVLDPWLVARVTAVLSPQLSWTQNQVLVERLLWKGEPVRWIRKSVDKAIALIAGDDPDTVLGPKTGRFARNLMGDTSCVTIDSLVWRRIRPRTPYSQLYRVGVYETVEEVFLEIGQSLRFTGCGIAAVMWLQEQSGRR